MVRGFKPVQVLTMRCALLSNISFFVLFTLISDTTPISSYHNHKRRRGSPIRKNSREERSRSPPEISSSTSGGDDASLDVSQTPPLNPLLQERFSSEELRHVTCHLETKDLWDKFNDLGTEMIITKTGR